MFPSQTQVHSRTGHAADVNWFKKDDPGMRPGCWALKMQAAQATGPVLLRVVSGRSAGLRLKRGG